jgi:hypothetical protein
VAIRGSQQSTSPMPGTRQHRNTAKQLGSGVEGWTAAGGAATAASTLRLYRRREEMREKGKGVCPTAPAGS